MLYVEGWRYRDWGNRNAGEGVTARLDDVAPVPDLNLSLILFRAGRKKGKL